jgi:uncharacterized membrane protein
VDSDSWRWPVDRDALVQHVGEIVESAGVLTIVVGVAVASVIAVTGLAPRHRHGQVYNKFRQNIGRAILLGLELLVAGDIIRTVVISPTLESVGVLAIIVVIRTFLSFSLQVEVDGRWPWQGDQGGNNL